MQYMAKVLVVGGAGYVGSAACAWLMSRGHEVWVLDDLSTGHRELVLPSRDRFTLARAGDKEAVTELLRRERMECVMHFAAKSIVSESVLKPELYVENNIDQTRRLLEAMLDAGVKRFIFSSTCAVFGNPGNQNIHEDLPKNPINPYGETKLEVEKMLARFADVHGLQSVALRYFNAAGAEEGLRVGEWHQPETHLIPNVLGAALAERPIQVFGKDYPTPDGTCVRDYVHVSDLAAAHEAAMLRLLGRNATQGSFEAFNLGSEKGFSVLEVIQACERVVGKKLKVEIKDPRPGDPPRLVADSKRARTELGFSVMPDALETIIETAWSWEKKKQAPGKAVFLDRDGTLNFDPGYLNDPEQMRLLPGVGDALAELKDAGYLLVVVSNQSGVGRGLIPAETLPRIHERLDLLLRPWGIKIDHYELCIHHPDDGCDCRKPSPKLIQDAAQALNVDVSRSWMVGDKLSDVGAGNAAGCRGSVLVLTGYGQEASNSLKEAGARVRADFIGKSLPDVARWILAQGTSGS